MSRGVIRTTCPYCGVGCGLGVAADGALSGDADNAMVRSAERSPPPLSAAPLVETWRPVPTTAAEAGDSAIGSSPG